MSGRRVHDVVHDLFHLAIHEDHGRIEQGVRVRRMIAERELDDEVGRSGDARLGRIRIPVGGAVEHQCPVISAIKSG